MLAAVVGVTGSGTAGPAAAVPSDDAQQVRRAAEQASARVDELTAQLDAELAERDRAMLRLGASVQNSIGSQTAADDAGRRSVEARGRHARAVRALYRTGGQLNLYVTVLGAGSVEDVVDRAAMAGRVLDLTAGRAGERRASADRAIEQSAAADQAVDDHLATAAQVTDATERVKATLDAAQAELDSLSERASHLEATEQARQRLEAARARAATQTFPLVGRASANPVPPAFLALYQHAATRCPGMRWTLLAAVGQVESGHGRSNGPSSAGAVGPMQFLPSTFAAHAVDGDGDGTADPWSPADAIETAAAFLCGNGGGGDEGQVERALLRYNNAQWYVQLVLDVEQGLIAATPPS